MTVKKAKLRLVELFGKHKEIHSHIEKDNKTVSSENLASYKKQLAHIRIEMKSLKEYLKQKDKNLVFIPGEKPKKLSETN